MTTCDGCKYWSEMVAWSEGNAINAMCLCHESSHYSKMVRAGCNHYTEGRAIDDPCPVADEIGDDFGFEE